MLSILSSLKFEKAGISKMPEKSDISNYFLNLYKVKIISDIIGFDHETNRNKKPRHYHQLPRRVLLRIFRYFTEQELQMKIMPVRIFNSF